MFVSMQPHIQLRSAGINGSKQWVRDTQQSRIYSLEEALSAGLITTVPARYEHVLITRTGTVHAWNDDLPRLVWHRRAPTNPDCYALLWDYVEREVWILECNKGAGWYFAQRSDFQGVEKALHPTGVPHERAVVLAAPACAVCQRRDALLIDPWQVCPACVQRHTRQCIEHRAEQVQTLEVYLQRWPNACRVCNEEGEKVWYSTSYYEPNEYEACPKCTGQGRCPHCGRPGLTNDNQGPCHWCGWNYGASTMPATAFSCLCRCPSSSQDTAYFGESDPFLDEDELA